MLRIPSQVSGLLDELTAQLPIILRGNLASIYLYGSLTQNAFNPQRSDIDCIVVTHRAFSDAHFRRLRRWLAEAALSNPWVSRLQMLFLIRNEVLTRNSRACLYQFGRLRRIRSDANPIIWMNVLKSGITLFGPSPVAFVPVITPEILFHALKREVGYLRAEISEKPDSEWRDVPFYRAYAVLTLCRILYSLVHGTVVAKPTAAKWAMKHLPEKWRAIILQALASDRDRENRSAPISLVRIRQFIDFADARLRATPAESRCVESENRSVGRPPRMTFERNPS